MEQVEAGSSRKRLSKVIRDWGPPLMLAVILLLGAFLRLTNLNWDERVWIHPDEAHMRTIASTIEMPDSLSLYFDTHRSPANCRNEGQRYSYGTLPLFTVRAVAEWLESGCGSELASFSDALQMLVSDGLPRATAAVVIRSADFSCGSGAFTDVRIKEIGRVLSTLADLGTVLLMFLLGRRLYGESVGLLAAALGALTAFSIQQAHFFTVDSAMCFFVTLTAYFAVRAGQSGSWVSFGLAGLATGLAAACKVSAAPAALLVVLGAVAWVWAMPGARGWGAIWGGAMRLALAGTLALVAFRVAQPYAFEGPGFFGVRLSPEWSERLEQIRAEQSGDVNSYPDQQWTSRPAILFPWLNMVIWGTGLPMGLAAWAGWALAGLELLRGKRAHLVLWGWATVFFLYQGTRWVKSMRYFVPLYPILAIMAAYLLVRLCRAPARRLRALGYGLATVVVVSTALWALAVTSIYMRSHTRLAASRWIFANVPEGSVLANEHWDWGPPLPLDGNSPAFLYDGFEMQNYHEDTLDKRMQLFEWLDRADYIILGSNRLYASIPRLQPRYPLTTEYYRALFAGELGFELVADFTSRPALFGLIQFPDQETPFPLMEMAADGYVYQTEPIKIVLPPAEEAFSVYDHPRVLIFRKTAAYSRQLVEKVLGGIDVSRALHNLRPSELTAAPHLFEFDPATWAEQQEGGTWFEMFDRGSLLNRYPGLAAVAWWVVMTALGWLVFPLLFVALPRLRDRGYGMVRVLGLLLPAYLTWLVASLRILPNTRGTILCAVLLVAVVGGGVGWLKRKHLRDFVRRRWRLLVLTEILAATLYAAWIGVRMLQPDLWHPFVGGEKPMDFAYLNAVMKSTWFPPYNPWFSGSYVNYYYFGFVIVGTLIKLMGTVPAIAYNLAIPLLFSLTGVGAFSVAYNLFGGHRRGALLAGLLALALTILLGNLGVVHLVRDSLITLGGDLFPTTIPGFAETVALVRGLYRVIIRGDSLPIRIEWWYWHPTRIIPAATGNPPMGTGGPIEEFPAFTFLYGDLHAHMIAFPLTLLALALGVCWARSRRAGWLSIAIGGLVIGALRPTNTWDYYPYLALGLVALALGAWTGRSGEGRVSRERLRRLLVQAVALTLLSTVLFLPYIQNYAGYDRLEMWRGGRTPLGIYLWIHGIMLFPVVTRLLIEVYRALSLHDCAARWGTVTGALVLCILALVLAVLGFGVALATVPIGAMAALLILMPRTPASRRLLWLMVGLAMSIGLGVEVVRVAGDVGRQNTVFKFYLQAWILLSIAAAVSLAWVRERTRRWQPRWRRMWWIAAGLLMLGGALFLPFGIQARAVDRMAQQTGLTLDGMAFVEHAVVHDGPLHAGREIVLAGDYRAIRWMQDEIPGSPVVLEGLGWREYLWGNRISIYTGLPTVAGWRWHQVQQRLFLPASMVEWRRSDVETCYGTIDVGLARKILDTYGVRYIYVGDYERAYYDAAGLAKFDAMVNDRLMSVAYDAHGVKIYEVIDR